MRKVEERSENTDHAVRKRVMFVELNTDGTVGGSYFSLLYLVCNLDKSLFEPIVVFAQSNWLIAQFHEAGIHVKSLVPRTPLKTRWSIIRPLVRLTNFSVAKFRQLTSTIHFVKLLKAERVDLLHLNESVENGYEWLIASKIVGIPCVTHQRGYIRKPSVIRRWWSRRFVSVICISESVHDNLKELRFGGRHLETIHNGLDPAAISLSAASRAVREELGIRPDERIIGMVGNVQRWKGQDVVINAVHKIAAEFPDLVCMLVGDVSPSVREDIQYGSEIRDLIRRLGLEDRVRLVGHKKNVADYVFNCDLLIHASVSPEPFGRVLLEAMAQRKSIIACRAGGAKEIVVHGETGLLYRPGDADELAHCIARLYADEQLRTSFGAAGYKRLTEHFSIESNVAATMVIYNKILS
jgi:glycosyltransferase involved in cell wall biosynthesis